MDLLETVRRLMELDETSTIYALRPWRPSSIAVVDSEPADGTLPAEAASLRCEYFLEVSIASEFLKAWRNSLGREPSLSESCQRLIKYAENDA